MLSENVGGIPQTVVTSGGYGDGGMGFGGGWGFILGLLFGRGGFGFGGGYGYGGGAVANVDNTIWTAQNFGRLENGQTAIQAQLNGIGQGICDATFALNNSIKDGTYSNAMAIQDSKYSLGNGICNSTYAITNAIKDCLNKLFTKCKAVGSYA